MYMIKNSDNTVTFMTETEFFRTLENIGVTETTGSSEQFENGWTLYQGDNNETVLAISVKEGDIVPLNTTGSGLSNKEWTNLFKSQFHVSGAYAKKMLHVLMDMKRLYTKINNR